MPGLFMSVVGFELCTHEYALLTDLSWKFQNALSELPALLYLLPPILFVD